MFCFASPQVCQLLKAQRPLLVACVSMMPVKEGIEHQDPSRLLKAIDLAISKGKRSTAQKLKAQTLFILRRQSVEPKCMLYGGFADKIKTLTDYNMLYHSSLFTGSRHCKIPRVRSVLLLSHRNLLLP